MRLKNSWINVDKILRSGYEIDEQENENKSKRGYYWIANSHDEIHAYYLRVGDGVHDILKTSRCIGVPIRAVSK